MYACVCVESGKECRYNLVLLREEGILDIKHMLLIAFGRRNGNYSFCEVKILGGVMCVGEKYQ